MSTLLAVASLNHQKGEHIDVSSAVEKFVNRYANAKVMSGEYCVGAALWDNGSLPPSFASEMVGLSARGGQSRVWVICDGRIDNRDDLLCLLRRQRIGAQPSSAAELILAAYLQWGQDCCRHLIGDFAFIISDHRTKTMLCVRDPGKLRPLFYASTSKFVVCSSEIDAILEFPFVSSNYNIEYFRSYIIDPVTPIAGTPYKSINRVRGGCALEITSNSIYEKQWWFLPQAGSLSYGNIKQYGDHLKSTLGNVVSSHMQSDSPICIAMSGGIDSCSVASLAVEKHRRSDGLGPAIKGLTLAFPDLPESDEGLTAANVARHIGLPHESVLLHKQSYCQDLTALLRILPEPNIIAPMAVAHRKIADACLSESSKVLLGGMGGDELFFGHISYLGDILRERQIPLLLCETARWIRYGYPLSKIVGKVLRHLTHPELIGDRRKSFFPWLRPSNSASALSPQYALALPPIRNPQIRKWRSVLTDMEQPMGAISRYIYQLAGIERRNPYWSRPMMEFAFALPLEVKIGIGHTKPLLRSAFGSRIPTGMTTRYENLEAYVQQGIYSIWDELWQLLDTPSAMLDEIIDVTILRQELPRLRRSNQSAYIMPTLLAALWLKARE